MKGRTIRTQEPLINTAQELPNPDAGVREIVIVEVLISLVLLVVGMRVRRRGAHDCSGMLAIGRNALRLAGL